MSTVTERYFSIGNVISQSFQVFTRNIVPFGVLSFLVFGLPQFAIGLLPFAKHPAGFWWRSWSTAEMASAFSGLAIIGVVYFVLSFVLYCALVYGTFRDLSGNPASIGDLIRHGLARVLPVIGMSILAFLGVMIGFMLFFIPGIILLCMWAVAVPVNVVEAPGVIASLSRSAELTRGYRWNVFGLGLIYYVGSIIVSVLLLVFVGVLTFLLPVLGAVLSGAVNGVMVAFATVMFTVLYAELRRLKDGVDASEIAKVFD